MVENKIRRMNKNIEEENKEKNIFKKIIKIILIIFLLIYLLFMYMHVFGTKGLVVREYKVESAKLPDKFDGLKIVHFSDLYYLSTIKSKELNNLVNKINEIRPEIIVFTGDLISDKKTVTNDDINDLIDAFNKMNATIGKYAVKGDLDYNSYYNQVMDETDFKVINNSYELIYYKDINPILITGTSSCIHDDCDIENSYSFNGIDNIYTISLVHEPDIVSNIINNKPDLILAGHSLNGQIRLPLIGGIRKLYMAKKYNNYKYNIDNSTLFISGGLGTNKYELRFFNRPSINLYRLVKETN